MQIECNLCLSQLVSDQIKNFSNSLFKYVVQKKNGQKPSHATVLFLLRFPWNRTTVIFHIASYSNEFSFLILRWYPTYPEKNQVEKFRFFCCTHFQSMLKFKNLVPHFKALHQKAIELLHLPHIYINIKPCT